MRRMDIFGEEFLTYYEEGDWDYLMENIDHFAGEDTRHFELWMLYREGYEPDERVCVWP